MNNDTKKLVDYEGLRHYTDQLKTKFEEKEDVSTAITDAEIASLFDISDLEDKYVSQDTIEETLDTPL